MTLAPSLATPLRGAIVALLTAPIWSGSRTVSSAAPATPGPESRGLLDFEISP